MSGVIVGGSFNFDLPIAKEKQYEKQDIRKRHKKKKL